jgi:cytochrome P450
MSETDAYPPGPRPGWFGLSTLRDFRRDPLRQLERLHEEYGDAVSYRIGPYRQFLFFHPDAIRQLLVSKARSFQRFAHQLRVLRQWNGDSMLIVEGDAWIRKRRLVQPAFGPKRLAGYVPPMAAEAVQLCDRWGQRLARGGPVTLDVQPEMNALTLNVISQTMFGADLSSSAAEIGQAVATLSQVGVDEFQSPLVLPRWIPTPKNRRKHAAIRTLDQTVRRLIAEHERGDLAAPDLLTALLTHTETDPDGSVHRLSREEIRNEIMTLLLAGHDTTAASLIWMLYELARNPELQRRARAEVDQVVGQRGIAYDDVSQLELLDRTLKETLRLHPPAIGVFLRQAMEDVEILGWRLRKGDLAGAYSWVVHRDPRWFPEPERFDPDRFLPERSQQLPQGAYFPFGAGPRMCIGMGMATLETLVVTATLLRRFEFDVPAGATPPRPLGQLSLRPEAGMPLCVRPREQPVAAETTRLSG